MEFQLQSGLTNDMHFIFAIHNPSKREQTRRQRDKILRPFPGRKIGANRNKNNGFVDKADMSRELYQCDRVKKNGGIAYFFTS